MREELGLKDEGNMRELASVSYINSMEDEETIPNHDGDNGERSHPSPIPWCTISFVVEIYHSPPRRPPW